jgi:hypothetical protein
MRTRESRGDASAIRYGDVVIFSDGSLAVVWVSGEIPEIVIAGRETVQRVVGHHDELPPEIRSALEHFVA